jgi:hypothetical protein
MNPKPSSSETETESRKRRNPAEINLKVIVIFAGIIVVMVGIVLGGLKQAVRHFEKTARQNDLAQLDTTVLPGVTPSRAPFPAPREQVSPRVDLETFRAQENAELNSYGWIDRQAGTVRIPIARAMELLSQRAASASSSLTATNQGKSILTNQQHRPFEAVTNAAEEVK